MSMEAHLVGLGMTLVLVSGLARGAITDLDRSDFAAGDGPIAVTHGDFNHDRRVDLAVADSLGGAVTVLLGGGDGGFLSPVSIGMPAGYTGVDSVVAGDFNGDGVDDLAATVGYAATNQSRVMVLTSGGDGTFTVAEFLTGYGAVWIDAGDLDSDGDLDLVTVNSNSRSLTRLFNDGDGGFGDVSHTITLRYPKRVKLADMDSDGDLDIALSSNYGVMVYKGDGLGGIVQSRQYYAGTRPKAFAFGDIDQDKDVDMLVSDLVTARVLVFMGDGLGDFGAGVAVPVGSGPSDIALDDVDGDGYLDLLVAAQSDSAIQSLLNDRSGGFGAAQSRATGSMPLAMIVCDVNGDGVNDVTTANYDADSVSFFASAACGADFNHDGVLDFFDVSAFLVAYTGGDLSVDFDGSGTLDFFDVSTFLVAFNAGCP